MDDTPWTSLDFYYKGVHVKKSLPQNVELDMIIRTVDTYLEAGFKPSWNEDTNKVAMAPKAPQTPSSSPTIENKTKSCSIVDDFGQPSCAGTMTLKTGISKKNGKKWAGWFCDANTDHIEWVGLSKK